MRDKRERTKKLLGAGTITGLLLILFFAFGGTSIVSALRQQSPTDTLDQLTASNMALQTANDEMAATLLQMQEREGQYRTQLESANQTIASLESDLATTTDLYDQLVTQVETLQAREATFQTNIRTANASLKQVEADVSAGVLTNEEAQAALAQQNAELNSSVQLMQQRESELIALVESANQTITQLNGRVNAQSGEYSALKSQYDEAVNVIQVMQQREQQYAGQINSANQTIANLQAQLQQQANANSGGGYYEDDDDDDRNEGNEGGERYEDDDD